MTHNKYEIKLYEFKVSDLNDDLNISLSINHVICHRVLSKINVTIFKESESYLLFRTELLLF